MFKRLILFLSICMLLTGCGHEEGDLFILKETTQGSDTIDSYQAAIKEAKTDGTFDVDGDYINTLFKGDTVMYIKEDKNKGYTQVQMMDGLDEDTKWWIPSDIFEKVIKKK
ncbi:hypothetical protein [Bacillus subtilis]|uniref:hypothetical protein n=1 Tax=Bacillus subtilis TaxID=1423 RepID=UPI002DB8A212|nr:hypothetical protein [Bacillus subtilis]MEC1404196.1 hypothetical protein [Bacillus subtilis]